MLDCDRPRGTNAAHWPAVIQCDKYVSKVIKSCVIRWSTWSTSSWRTRPTTPPRVPCGLHPHPGEHGQLLREERPVKVACATSHKVGIIVKLSLVVI